MTKSSKTPASPTPRVRQDDTVSPEFLDAYFAAQEPAARGISEALGAEGDRIRQSSDVISAVVSFANAEISPSWENRVEVLLRSRPVNGGACVEARYRLLAEALPGNRFPVLTADKSVAREFAEEKIEDERAYARKVLDLAARGRSAISAALRKSNDRRVLVRSIPTLRFPRLDRAEIVWGFEGPANDSRGWVKFAAALIASAAKSDQTMIGKCQLESCGRHFVIVRGRIGKPQTKYCCEAHRLDQHNLMSAKRQRLFRERRGQRLRRSRMPK